VRQRIIRHNEQQKAHEYPHISSFQNTIEPVIHEIFILDDPDLGIGVLQRFHRSQSTQRANFLALAKSINTITDPPLLISHFDRKPCFAHADINRNPITYGHGYIHRPDPDRYFPGIIQL
jgi:hypothetical protein